MILTLEVPPDVEAKLREGAANHDAATMRTILTEALAPVVDAAVGTLLKEASEETARRVDGLTDVEFEMLADEVISLPPALPALSDAVISREGIYENHP